LIKFSGVEELLVIERFRVPLEEEPPPPPLLLPPPPPLLEAPEVAIDIVVCEGSEAAIDEVTTGVNVTWNKNKKRIQKIKS
jgi:hypothetical protein